MAEGIEFEYEFDCTECARHIVVLSGRDSWQVHGLCSLCQHLPKWFDDPEARRIFDSDGKRGMAWWNGLTPGERVYWMERGGNTGVAADAWDAFRKRNKQ
jgi:hypothetical protein